jgi:hypothetical protein
LLAFAENPSCKSLSSGELTMLLEGTTFTVHTRARRWRRGDARTPGAAHAGARQVIP